MPSSGGMAGTGLTKPQDLLTAIAGNPATLTQFRGTNFTFGGGWVEPTLRGVDQTDRNVQVATVRDQRAAQFTCARHFAAVHIAVEGVVAEDQFRMRAVGADGPEGMAEVRTLVQILRAHPDDAPVVHDRGGPFAQIGVG